MRVFSATNFVSHGIYVKENQNVSRSYMSFHRKGKTIFGHKINHYVMSYLHTLDGNLSCSVMGDRSISVPISQLIAESVCGATDSIKKQYKSIPPKINISSVNKHTKLLWNVGPVYPHCHDPQPTHLRFVLKGNEHTINFTAAIPNRGGGDERNITTACSGLNCNETNVTTSFDDTGFFMKGYLSDPPWLSNDNVNVGAGLLFSNTKDRLLLDSVDDEEQALVPLRESIGGVKCIFDYGTDISLSFKNMSENIHETTTTTCTMSWQENFINSPLCPKPILKLQMNQHTTLKCNHEGVPLHDDRFFLPHTKSDQLHITSYKPPYDEFFYCIKPSPNSVTLAFKKPLVDPGQLFCGIDAFAKKSLTQNNDSCIPLTQVDFSSPEHITVTCEIPRVLQKVKICNKTSNYTLNFIHQSFLDIAHRYVVGPETFIVREENGTSTSFVIPDLYFRNISQGDLQITCKLHNIQKSVAINFINLKPMQERLFLYINSQSDNTSRVELGKKAGLLVYSVDNSLNYILLVFLFIVLLQTIGVYVTISRDGRRVVTAHRFTHNRQIPPIAHHR